MALRDVVRLRPQVVVVDGRMPDGDGLRVCQTLRRVAPDVACVIVAVGIETWGAPEAAAAGAAAYVLKAPKSFRLVEVVRAVAGGARPLDGLIEPR